MAGEIFDIRDAHVKIFDTNKISHVSKIFSRTLQMWKIFFEFA